MSFHDEVERNRRRRKMSCTHPATVLVDARRQGNEWSIIHACCGLQCGCRSARDGHTDLRRSLQHANMHIRDKMACN